MIEVLVLGQPFQATRIARLLNHGANDLHATVILPRQYPELLAQSQRAPVVVMRAGYRIGADTSRGRLFDGFWALLRQRIKPATWSHYWLGSDVMRTIEDSRSGAIRRGPLDGSRDDLHLTVAPWLTDELRTVGIRATTALLPPPRDAPQVPPPLPAGFIALCYLPPHRFAFFGGDAILEAARRLPHVRFDVVANDGSTAADRPPNVVWHGWVPNMADRYEHASVVVRVPKHDGYGNSVIEGLLYARHIVYTYEVPFTRRLWPLTSNGLVTVLSELADEHARGTLVPNTEGRAFAQLAFDPVRLGDELRAIIRAAV